MPALQIQAILNEPTPGEMEDALAALPMTLHEAFSNTVSRIQGQLGGRKRLAMDTLSWISHATRPLLISELSEALAIRSGQSHLNSKYRPSQKLMIECCMGLVVVDEQSKTIRLVHYTVQEFFRERQREIFPNGEELLAEKCLTYLLYDVFATGCCPDEENILDRLDLHGFYSYCASEWGYHVRESQSLKINEMTLQFLRSQPHKAASTQVYQYNLGVKEVYWEPIEVNSVTELDMTCYFGLENVAKDLLDSGTVDVNHATHIGTTAIVRAASTGHPGLVRMLLDRGADPTLANWYGNALLCAAEAGHCSTIQELLNFGMDINTRNQFNRTALHCTIDNGSELAMKLLIEHGADIEALDGDGKMLWHDLAESGHIRMMKFLLDRGFDPETRCKRGLTALHLAASGGHIKVMRMLLEMGVDMNARANNSLTPLHYAAHLEIHLKKEAAVRVLLEAGADVNAEDRSGMTAVSIAAAHRFWPAVRTLREFGAKMGPFEYLQLGLGPTSVEEALQRNLIIDDESQRHHTESLVIPW